MAAVCAYAILFSYLDKLLPSDKIYVWQKSDMCHDMHVYV